MELGKFMADGRGAFTGTVTIPASASVGRHHIVVTGRNPSGGKHAVAFLVDIAANAEGAKAGARLPRTGTSIISLLLVAAGLLVAGRFLLVIKREVEGGKRT